MKIFHILDHSLPLHSGYSFRSQSILREQRKRGWEPIVVTSPKHEASWKGPWKDKEEINGFSYYRTGIVPRGSLPGANEAKLMWALGKRITEVAKLEKPDILHAHSPVLNGIPALWVGRRLGIPVVYEIRAFWEDAAVDHGTSSEGSMKYRATRFVEGWVCRKVDHVFVLCRGLQEDLTKRGIAGDKMTVIYNGIDPKEFAQSPGNEELKKAWNLYGKKVVGFIGSFYRYEGLDLLVDAFAKIAGGRNDVALLLVGGGEMEQELRRQVKHLGMDEIVIMPGRVSHDRVPDVYATIDVLAYPRYSMRLTEVVTPLKPLEAMAMGKALIASDVDGHKELIRHGETGVLFKAGELDDLAGKITGLLADGNRREAIQRQGRDWVRQNHTWEKTTSPYEQIYVKLGAK